MFSKYFFITDKVINLKKKQKMELDLFARTKLNIL